MMVIMNAFHIRADLGVARLIFSDIGIPRLGGNLLPLPFQDTIDGRDLIRSPDGTVEFLEDGGSLPLGGAFGAVYREATHPITPGSTLVLYTDGLVEATGLPASAFCLACFTGDYPVPPDEIFDKHCLERQGGAI